MLFPPARSPSLVRGYWSVIAPVYVASRAWQFSVSRLLASATVQEGAEIVTDDTLTPLNILGIRFLPDGATWKSTTRYRRAEAARQKAHYLQRSLPGWQPIVEADDTGQWFLRLRQRQE